MDVERGSDIKKIDCGIKNKFQWKWIENKDQSGTFLSDYFRKIDVAGKARCTVCNQTIKYGSSGAKALMKHGLLCMSLYVFFAPFDSIRFEMYILIPFSLSGSQINLSLIYLESGSIT